MIGLARHPAALVAEGVGDREQDVLVGPVNPGVGCSSLIEGSLKKRDPSMNIGGREGAPTGCYGYRRKSMAIRLTTAIVTMPGRPFYDPAAIARPVLMVAAERDADTRLDMTHDLFARLTGAPYKQFVEIGRATHMAMMQRNRRQAFNAVRAFLGEGFLPGT